MNTAEMIYQQSKELPESYAQEVLDFIGYLQEKKLKESQESFQELEDFLQPRIDSFHKGEIVNKSVLEIFENAHRREMQQQQ